MIYFIGIVVLSLMFGTWRTLGIVFGLGAMFILGFLLLGKMMFPDIVLFPNL